MKIWHISDTHTYHDLLVIPNDVDMVIHSGDCSNPMDKIRSFNEIANFIRWFKELPIKYKIYVAGNHDSALESNTLDLKTYFKASDIIYLENQEIVIEGLKIFGSPYTPTFGSWAFMKAREKMHDLWKKIPDDIDILIVHGPARGFRDLSYNRNGQLEFCGDTALHKRIFEIKPKLFCFGHIHNREDIINQGVTIFNEIQFSNGSVVTDNKFGSLSSHGNFFNL